jgi:hypothetical protein
MQEETAEKTHGNKIFLSSITGLAMDRLISFQFHCIQSLEAVWKLWKRK